MEIWISTCGPNSLFGTAAAREDTLMLMNQESVSLPLVYRLSQRVTKIWHGFPAGVMEEISDRLFRLKLGDCLLGRWQALCEQACLSN